MNWVNTNWCRACWSWCSIHHYSEVHRICSHRSWYTCRSQPNMLQRSETNHLTLQNLGTFYTTRTISSFHSQSYILGWTKKKAIMTSVSSSNICPISHFFRRHTQQKISSKAIINNPITSQVLYIPVLWKEADFCASNDRSLWISTRTLLTTL